MLRNKPLHQLDEHVHFSLSLKSYTFKKRKKEEKRKLCLFPSHGLEFLEKVGKPRDDSFSLSGGDALPEELSAFFHGHLSHIEPKYWSLFQQQCFPFSIHPLWEQRGCSEGEGARLPEAPCSGAGNVHSLGLKYGSRGRLRGTLCCEGHDNIAEFQPWNYH